jgi:type VI secretion system protein ImpA
MTTTFIAHPAWAEWLDDISADLPCGPDLEYDPAFLLLEQAVSGRPEEEYGETVIAPVPPDWTAADALCLELMSRTRDIRVLACLARGRLWTEGVAGLADGLAVIAGLLERQWDHVHPQLEASDGGDPTARMNALAALADTSGFLSDFLDMPIIAQRSSQAAALTLREWTYATSETAASGQRTGLSVAEIEATLVAAIDSARSVRAALDVALAHALQIEALVAERVGTAESIDLGPLTALLRRAQSLLGEVLVKFDVSDANEMPEAPDGAPSLIVSRADGARMAAATNELATRGDVIAALDRLCDYYARHEPSSPVPLLLKRARGMVHKSFVDLLTELAPDGLAQLTQVVGTAGMSPSSD